MKENFQKVQVQELFSGKMVKSIQFFLFSIGSQIKTVCDFTNFDIYYDFIINWDYIDIYLNDNLTLFNNSVVNLIRRCTKKC